MDGPFRKRLRRRLYYGDKANMDTPSLPMTELSVEYFKDAVSQKLGHVGMDTASDLIRSNGVSPCSMVLSMMYAKRLKQKNQDYLSSMSSSDVFFISMMMASKYLYDEGVEEEVFNDEWADNSNQDIDDVNQMEVDFLKALNWHLFVRPKDFDDALDSIERRLALQEGSKRGWFTYSEMAVLADLNMVGALWTHIGLECSKLSSILCAAYVTSLLSMLGSTALAFQLAGPLSSATVTLMSMSAPTSLPPPISGPVNNCTTLLPGCLGGQGERLAGLTEGQEEESWTRRPPVLSTEACINKVQPKVGHSSCVNKGQPQVGHSSCVNKSQPEVGRSPCVNKGQQKLGRPLDSPLSWSSSSLWPLLLLDSLLSQLWAVGSVSDGHTRGQLHHHQHHQRRRCRLRQNPLSTPDGPGVNAPGDPLLSHPSQPSRRLPHDGLGPHNMENGAPSTDDELGSYNMENGAPSTPDLESRLRMSSVLASARNENSWETPPNSLDPDLQPCHHQHCQSWTPDPPPMLHEKAAQFVLSPLLSILPVSPGFQTSVAYIVQAT